MIVGRRIPSIFFENLNEISVTISESDMLWGRTSVVQFAFIDDQLINWEEDNLTLNMAKLDKKNGGTLIKYFGFLLNIILTIKVFSM